MTVDFTTLMLYSVKVNSAGRRMKWLQKGDSIKNEKEMLLIRVNTLENELRRIKERIEHIA